MIIAKLRAGAVPALFFNLNNFHTMKQLLFSIVLLLVYITGSAQTNVKQDATGNYIAVQARDTVTAKPTGKTYTDSKGNTYPVYVSKNGKLFVNRISKTGNPYRQYLKL